MLLLYDHVPENVLQNKEIKIEEFQIQSNNRLKHNAPDFFPLALSHYRFLEIVWTSP